MNWTKPILVFLEDADRRVLATYSSRTGIREWRLMMITHIPPPPQPFIHLSLPLPPTKRPCTGTPRPSLNSLWQQGAGTT